MTALLAVLTSIARADAGSNQEEWAASLRREWQSDLEANPHLPYRTSGILVRFRDGDDEAYRARVRGLIGDGCITGHGMGAGVELIHVRGPVLDAIERVAPYVVYAEPDWVVRVASIPNDPLFSSQWGLRNVGQVVGGNAGTAGADARVHLAWDTTTGSASFKIAVLDTGVQYTHPDLAANIWTNPTDVANGVDDDGNGWIDDVRGWDFVDGDNDPSDSNGHGTAAAGVLGAVGNNGLGVSGVNQQCQIVCVRVINAAGVGNASDVAAGIYYAAGRTADGLGTWTSTKVSNNSWVVNPSTTVTDAITWAGTNAGHLFVCPTGNHGLPSPFFPASLDLPSMISVLATDNDDQLASFSNYGATSVQIGAPGLDVYSADLVGVAGTNGQDYALVTGTSFASPIVAGIAALVWSDQPALTLPELRYRILSTARPLLALADKTITGGVVDAAEALAPGSTQAGVPYCAGDGDDPLVTTDCPCAPPDTVPSPAAAPGHGCANSLNLGGALLTSSGVAAPDSVTIRVLVAPAYLGFGFLVKGDATTDAGIAASDGIRCVSGALVRFGGHNAGTSGNPVGEWIYPNTAQTISVSTATLQPAGQTAYYQLFYRNAAASFCNSTTANWSNGQRIAWP